MIELATLELTKRRLKIDGTDDDVNIQTLIYAASRMVLGYLKQEDDYYNNSDGTMDLNSDGFYEEVPPEVATATILLVGILYRDPEGVETDKWKHGYLPVPVLSILYPLRDPALA